MDLWEDSEMDLWDEVDELAMDLDENISSNKYLDNVDEAMNLVSKILKINKSHNDLHKNLLNLNYLIDDKLLKLSCKIDMAGETQVFDSLKVIKSKLNEINMINLLDKKAIVGIGGMFSAGKSKFINSIIGYDILPENQLPTTSIPTYITKGKTRLSAYTYSNLSVDLDLEAINAISHVFYEKYNISFTRFIKSIVVENENYKYDNMVLLDTPGYTKAESYKKDDNTDENMAREQLKVCDYLIWLMDIENGTITNEDLNFITNLKLKKPILFVFNKADKKCDSDIKNIIENTKKTLEKTQLNVFGVTAYSSFCNQEYFENIIGSFFSEVMSYSYNREDIGTLLNNALNKYTSYFKNKDETLYRQKDSILASINKSCELIQVLNLAYLLSATNKDIIINKARIKEFNNLKTSILNESNKILNNCRVERVS